jgi:hypothetical protein
VHEDCRNKEARSLRLQLLFNSGSAALVQNIADQALTYSAVWDVKEPCTLADAKKDSIASNNGRAQEGLGNQTAGLEAN